MMFFRDALYNSQQRICILKIISKLGIKECFLAKLGRLRKEDLKLEASLGYV
jgi:hypothetical protein